MLSQIYQKLKTINPWHFLWISIVISEIFTLLLTGMFSYLFYGRLYKNIFLITTIDAFFVPLFVAPIVIYFLRHTAKLEELNERLNREARERERKDQLLDQANQDWEDTFNTITDIITIHDKDFNIIRANRAAEEILKLPAREFDKLIKCFQYYHGTDCAPQGCPSCDCLKTGKHASFELFEPHLKKFIEIRAIPRINEEKEIIGLIHVVRDISGRKKIEEAVKNTKMEWEMTFDQASEFMALVDRAGKILRCNKSFAAFADRQLKELLGMPCTDFIPISPEDLNPDRPMMKMELKTNNGRWLYLSYCPIVNKKNEFLKAIIVGSDITSLKSTEQKLLRSERELIERVEELEKFYEMAVDRELRMKQIKDENKKLKARLLVDTKK